VGRRRILFVDDELNILEGLRNLLRKQRHEWDMVFAQSGAEALAQLEQRPFDVILSDMRMPGMDGAELLTTVKRLYPAVARIILSGHAERETVMRSLPVAHQFLAKPCEAAALREAIDRTCELQALLDSAEIRALVGRLDKVPSIPHTFFELSRAAADPRASAAELATIIQGDAAMSAKVLQLANSAFFAGTQRKLSVAGAVTFLGVELLKSLALTAHVFVSLDEQLARELQLDHLQDASLLAAHLARRFMRDASRADQAFTGGLVRDIGRVVMAVGLPQSYRATLEAARTTGRSLHLVEKERLGVTHAEVGAYLLGVWGLPYPLVEVVAYHHAPALARRELWEVVGAVHVADAMASAAGAAEGQVDAAGAVDEPFFAQAGLVDELARWRAEAARVGLGLPAPG
jgi:HD-like signal output (HDOD) protein